MFLDNGDIITNYFMQEPKHFVRQLINKNSRDRLLLKSLVNSRTTFDIRSQSKFNFIEKKYIQNKKITSFRLMKNIAIANKINTQIQNIKNEVKLDKPKELMRNFSSVFSKNSFNSQTNPQFSIGNKKGKKMTKILSFGNQIIALGNDKMKSLFHIRTGTDHFFNYDKQNFFHPKYIPIRKYEYQRISPSIPEKLKIVLQKVNFDHNIRKQIRNSIKKYYSSK